MATFYGMHTRIRMPANAASDRRRMAAAFTVVTRRRAAEGGLADTRRRLGSRVCALEHTGAAVLAGPCVARRRHGAAAHRSTRGLQRASCALDAASRARSARRRNVGARRRVGPMLPRARMLFLNEVAARRYASGPRRRPSADHDRRHRRRISCSSRTSPATSSRTCSSAPAGSRSGSSATSSTSRCATARSRWCSRRRRRARACRSRPA